MEGSRLGAGGGSSLRTLLIDADAIAYRDAVAHQRTYDWGEGIVSTATDLPLAKKTAAQTIDKLMADLEADDLVICLSDDVHSFRKELVDPSYKANRNEIDRPVHLYDLKEWLFESYPSDRRARLEADDVMGILSTEPHTGDRIIVSQDKDMKTIPGLLYRPFSENPAVEEITRPEADRFHLLQTLMGDTVDGYPGARGVGPKNAARALDLYLGYEDYEHTFKAGPRKGLSETRWREVDMTRHWDIVVSMFRRAGLTAKDALTQARLARILRNEDWDGRSPILWQPGL